MSQTPDRERHSLQKNYKGDFYFTQREASPKPIVFFWVSRRNSTTRVAKGLFSGSPKPHETAGTVCKSLEAERPHPREKGESGYGVER